MVLKNNDQSQLKPILDEKTVAVSCWYNPSANNLSNGKHDTGFRVKGAKEKYSSGPRVILRLNSILSSVAWNEMVFWFFAQQAGCKEKLN